MKGAVSERAPQKYLIQNHSGVRLFYWAERVRPGLPSTSHQAVMLQALMSTEAEKVRRRIWLNTSSIAADWQQDAASTSSHCSVSDLESDPRSHPLGSFVITLTLTLTLT